MTHQVPAVTAMLRGHAAVAKKLLRAFSLAKIPPRKTHTIASVASVALAAGGIAADSASEPHPPAGVVDANNPNQAPSGGPLIHSNSKLAGGTVGLGNNVVADSLGAGEWSNDMEGNASDATNQHITYTCCMLNMLLVSEMLSTELRHDFI